MVLGTAETRNRSDENTHALCADCHLMGANPLGDSKPVEPPKKRACIECHDEILRSSQAKNASSVHTVGLGSQEALVAPLGGKSLEHLDCLNCHTPHSEGKPKFLRLGERLSQMRSAGMVFDLVTQHCLNCHPIAGAVKASGRHYVRHPVGIPVNRPGRILDRSQLPPLMDVKGTPDPSDDVIGCGTCHFVHASKNTFLLRWGPAELSAACLKCHPEVGPSGSKSKTLWVRR